MNGRLRSRHPPWVLAPLLAMVVAATACDGEDDTSADAEGSRAEVRLATVPNLVGWPVQGADDLGLFEERGVTVASVDVFDSGPPMIEAGQAGEWDVAALGSPPAIVAGDAWDLQIAGIQNEEAGNIVLYVREGEVDTTDPAAQLRGQQALLVGNSLGEQVFDACLEHFGMSPDDAQKVPLEMPQIFSSFNAGEGAVAQVWSEFVERMDAEGHLPLCDGEDAGEQVYTVFVVHPEFAEDDPEAAARVVAAIFEANALLADDLDGVLPSVLKFFSAHGVELSEEDVRLQNDRHEWYTLEESTELMRSSEAAQVLGATAEFFVAKGQYDEVPDFDFLNVELAERALSDAAQQDGS